MVVNIKNATVEDSGVISEIHALSWKFAYKGIVPQKYLDELKSDFWVTAFQDWLSKDVLKAQLIYENQKPIGCIAYGKARDEKFSKWGEIVSIYVLPEYFGKGYGQKLLNAALFDLGKMGYKNCYLWVLMENENARKFYEKNGFQCTNDEYSVEIMQKNLIDVRYIFSLENYLN